MPRYCAVKVCRNRGGSYAASKQERRISFYPFPLQDNGRLQKWVDNMKRDHEWAPSRHQFLCSEHFTEDCFNIRWGIRYLRNTAIPTIFPSVQHEVETKNQRPRPRACGTDTELSMSHSAPNKRPLILTRKTKATTWTTVGCSTICEDKDRQTEPKGLLELPLASGTNTNHVRLDERLVPEPLSAVHEVHGDSHSSCLSLCRGESLLPQEAADSVVSVVCRELLCPLSDGTERALGTSFSFVPVDGEPVKEKPSESVDRVSADRWPGEPEHVSVYEHSYCRADTDREQLWGKILNLHGKILELDHREETAVAKIRALESEIVYLKRDSAVFIEKQNILEDCISSILL